MCRPVKSSDICGWSGFLDGDSATELLCAGVWEEPWEEPREGLPRSFAGGVPAGVRQGGGEHCPPLRAGSRIGLQARQIRFHLFTFLLELQIL